MKAIVESRILKTIFATLEWILCAILVLLIILTGFQKFSNQGNFFGYRIYTIASGSMIPTYDIGDTLLIKEMPASEIHVGDAVTYISEKSGADGMIITHQVMQVNVDKDGKYSFHTKGIANNIEDPIVYEDQVLGKVVHKFFFLSFLGRITTNIVLIFIFVVIPIAFIIAMELFKILNDKDDEIEEEVEELKKKIKNKKEKEEEEESEEEEEIISEEKEEIEEEFEEDKEEIVEEEPKEEKPLKEDKKIEKKEEKTVEGVKIEEKKTEVKTPEQSEDKPSKKKKKRKWYYSS
ncbi:MAG: signal peptidase I [Bacilli bacterium]|nr:signal peptidase I [Bacilli bacterium]